MVLRAALGRATGPVERVRSGRRDEVFATPAGKRHEHRLDATRLRLGFPRRALEVLVADDGVAFRGRGAYRDTVRWRAQGASRAWLQKLRFNYENPYEPVRLAAAGRRDYAYPALVRTPGGDYALLFESGLPAGAAAGHLALGARGLRAARPSGEQATGGTAWRLAVIGTAATWWARTCRWRWGARRGSPTRRGSCPGARPGRGGRIARARRGDRRPGAPTSTPPAAAGWEYVPGRRGLGGVLGPGARRLRARSAACGSCSGPTGRSCARSATAPTFLDRLGGLGRRRGQARLPRVRPRRRGWRFMDEARAAAAAPAPRRRLPRLHRAARLPAHVANALTFEGVTAPSTPSPAPDRPGARRRSRVHAQRGRLDGLHARRAVRARTALDDGAPSRAGDRLRVRPPALRGPPGELRRPSGGLALLAAAPAAWDDTRLLAGAPGTHATVARRAGKAWFVGGLSATPARTEAVPLTFLAAGRSYAATVITDDGAGGLLVTEQVVTAAGTLRIPVAADGGFTIQMNPARESDAGGRDSVRVT